MKDKCCYDAPLSTREMLAGSVFQGGKEENLTVWGFPLAIALLKRCEESRGGLLRHGWIPKVVRFLGAGEGTWVPLQEAMSVWKSSACCGSRGVPEGMARTMGLHVGVGGSYLRRCTTDLWCRGW